MVCELVIFLLNLRISKQRAWKQDLHQVNHVCRMRFLLGSGVRKSCGHISYAYDIAGYGSFVT